MTDESKLSKLCFYYEMFMERAYGTYEICTLGCYAIDMRKLMTVEKQKEVSLESGIYFESLLLTLKMNIDEALDSYLAKSIIPANIIEDLKQYKDQVKEAASSEHLMKIIFDTIDLTVAVPFDME